jgi:aspartyl-tRNA(Asn)/glutamyl-tRNA(Gln) amidotransferase subunit C
MIHFDKNDLLKVAKLSALRLDETEISLFEKQIKSILEFVEQLQQVEMTAETEHARNVNIMREDVAHTCTLAQTIRNQSPEKEGPYFVVPKILD